MRTLGLPTDIEELRNFTFDDYEGARMPLGIAAAIAAGPDPASSLTADQIAMSNPYSVPYSGASPTLGVQTLTNMYTSGRVPYF